MIDEVLKSETFRRWKDCCSQLSARIDLLLSYDSAFRLQVTAGSKAAQGDLCPGDTILAINGDVTEHMTHMEAQNRIKNCTQQLTLIISRYLRSFSDLVKSSNTLGPFSASP